MTVKEMIKILNEQNPDFDFEILVGKNRYTVRDSQIVIEKIADDKVVGGSLAIVADEMVKDEQ